MPLVRFNDPPACLASSFHYGPFEIFYGTIPLGKPVLAAVWRREGTGLPYEAVSAAFVAQFIDKRKLSGPGSLPENDAELDEALHTLL